MNGATIKRNTSFFREVSAKLNQARQTALQVGGHEVLNELKVYPAATDANKPGRFTNPKRGRPKPMGYYERNRGDWSPRVNITAGSFGHFGKSLGRIKGGKSQQIAASLLGASTVTGYKLTSHSEQLGKKWTLKRGADYVIIANSVSYAKHVQGDPGQSQVMRKIGWGTITKAAQTVIRRGTFRTAFQRARAALGV